MISSDNIYSRPVFNKEENAYDSAIVNKTLMPKFSYILVVYMR